MSRYTYDEIVLALELYMRIPSSKINIKNPDIIELSEFVSTYYNSHSVGSIKMLLENFKSLNPRYTSVDGRVGLPNASSLMREVWDEFYPDGFRSLFDRANQIRINASGVGIDEMMLDDSFPLELDTKELYDIPPGDVKSYVTKVRVNQNVFRSHVLASFNNMCCITGIGNETVLRASHIKPWRVCNPVEKTNPANGLCLNPLHDLAFDQGLISIDHDCCVILSSHIDEFLNEDTIKHEFEIYDGKQIHLPEKMELKKEFIDYHNNHVLLA